MNAVLSEPMTLPQRVGQLIGLKLRTEVDFVSVVQKGLPTSAYRKLSVHIPLDSLYIASETTLRRRLQTKRGSFATEESERLMRLARVFALAVEVFGDEERAREWFTRPAPYVSDEDPMSPAKLCETEPGGRLVEEHLRRAQFGFVS